MATKLESKLRFFIVSAIMLVSVMSVSAAAPIIVWHNPSSNGQLYWQNFTLNVSTNINANCTYQVTYVNSTPAIPPTNFTTGQNTTDHTTLLDVDSLPAAHTYVIIVDCFNATNASEITTGNESFQRDPDCGDTVSNSWTLGHDMTGCSGTGLNLTGGVTFNCNSHPLSGSGGTGILIDWNNGNNNNITMMNCNLSSFGNGIVILGDNIAVINSTLSTINGITITSPRQNILINHSTFYPTSNGRAIDVQQTTNLTIINSIFKLSTDTIGIALQRTKNPTTITNNLFDLTADATGIELDRTNTTIIQHNNFLPATNHNNFPLTDLGGNVNVTLDNNYWGHSSCSLFSYLVDTNATTLIDHYPVSQQDNWTSSINCSDQSVFAGFASATLYDGDGSTALNVQGYDYYYDENNTEHNITDVLLGGVSPWKMYTTYYYPGDQIVFDVNISPANFKFVQFGIEGNSFQSYTLQVTNLTSANGSAGVYRVNISNYVFNSSNEEINGSLLPRVLNFYFRTTDDRGATRLLWIEALYNFTVQDALSSLGGNTTNWSDIPDMSNVSGLTFDLPGQGKIVFTTSVDLTDPAFLSALRDLASLIILANGTIGLDSGALAALNVSANLTFYNVSGLTGLNTSTLNTTFLSSKLLMDGEVCNSSVCTATEYNSTTDTFAVSVAHWTNYSIDTNPPVISGASPSGSLSSSTTSVTLQVTTDEPATCKYGTTDTDYSSLPNTFTTTGALTHQETYAVSSGNSYTFYVRCQDAINNTNTASTTISFSVASPSSGGSGGGGGSSYTTSPILTTEERTIQLGQGGFYYFTTKAGGDDYKLALTSLTDTEATLSVDGKTFTLKEGESRELDVDGNGVKDTYVELKTIGAYTVTIGIRKASTTSEATGEAGTAGAGAKSETTTTETTEPETTTTETTAPETNKNAEQPAKEATTKENSSAETKTSSHWLLWTLLLIGLAIVVIVVVQRSKRTR